MASARPLVTRRLACQVAGFALGIALLGWCISIALRPDNQSQLAKLKEASPASIAALLGLSIATLFCNGTLFWSLIQPAARLGFWHVQMVNSIATCLAYVPFKLSLIFRFFIHRTRDHIPIFTISAWMAAAAAALLAALGPIAAIAAGRFGQGRSLLALSIGPVVLTSLVAWLLARAFAGPAGLARLSGLLARTRLPLIPRLTSSAAFGHLHAGFDMVANPRAWSLTIAARLADLLVQAWRFQVAAGILGLHLDPSPALLLALAYYFLGAASPSGALGVREGGTTGLAMLLHIDRGEHFAAVALLVTAADAIPTLTAAVLGWIVLLATKTRPHSQPPVPLAPHPPVQTP